MVDDYAEDDGNGGFVHLSMGIGLTTPWSILLEYADDVDDDNGCDGNADDSNNGD